MKKLRKQGFKAKDNGIRRNLKRSIKKKSLSDTTNGITFKSARGKVRSKKDIEEFKGLKRDIKWFLGVNKISTTSGGRKIIHTLLRDIVFKLLDSLKGHGRVLNKNEVADKIVFSYDDFINGSSNNNIQE